MTYTKCQSCSMPLKKDGSNLGTAADGTKSEKFCTLWYANGVFTQPDWTVDQMQAFVKGKMQEMHIPGFLAGAMAKGVRKLERWARKS